MVWPNIRNLTVLPDGEQEKLIDYRNTLAEALVSVAASALRNLSPATIEFGEGAAGFAVNRRAAINPNGPVDHRVPVMKIADPAGRIRESCSLRATTGSPRVLPAQRRLCGVRGGGQQRHPARRHCS
jgi:hypothetical protein